MAVCSQASAAGCGSAQLKRYSAHCTAQDGHHRCLSALRRTHSARIAKYIHTNHPIVSHKPRNPTPTCTSVCPAIAEVSERMRTLLGAKYSTSRRRVHVIALLREKAFVARSWRVAADRSPAEATFRFGASLPRSTQWLQLRFSRQPRRNRPLPLRSSSFCQKMR